MACIIAGSRRRNFYSTGETASRRVFDPKHLRSSCQIGVTNVGQNPSGFSKRTARWSRSTCQGAAQGSSQSDGTSSSSRRVAQTPASLPTLEGQRRHSAFFGTRMTVVSSTIQCWPDSSGFAFLAKVGGLCWSPTSRPRQSSIPDLACVPSDRVLSDRARTLKASPFPHRTVRQDG